MGTHWNCLIDVFFMCTHIIYFYGEMMKIFSKLSRNYVFIWSAAEVNGMLAPRQILSALVWWLSLEFVNCPGG